GGDRSLPPGAPPLGHVVDRRLCQGRALFAAPPPPPRRSGRDSIRVQSGVLDRRMPPGRDQTMIAPRAFHEKNVTLANGLTIHYYEWPGPKPNLVLLHPSSGYGRMW